MRIAYITRFGEGMLPRPDTAYQQGDTVHIMMRTDDINEVSRILSRSPRTDEDVEYSTDPRLDWFHVKPIDPVQHPGDRRRPKA